MFRTRVTFLLVALLCCTLAVSACADRLILIPTGSTVTGLKGEFLAGDGDEKAYWANVGISRVEVEGAWFRDFDSEDSDAISAQVSVLPETSFTPALSLGVRDISDDTNGASGLYNGRSIFLAASKGIPYSEGIPFLQDVKLHAGVGTGSLSGVFFGAEAGLPGGLHVRAEYDTEDFNYAASLGVFPLVRVELVSIKSDIYYGARLSASF
jgi:hypothetical protein